MESFRGAEGYRKWRDELQAETTARLKAEIRKLSWQAALGPGCPASCWTRGEESNDGLSLARDQHGRSGPCSLCASPRDLVWMPVPLKVWELQMGNERNELDETTK